MKHDIRKSLEYIQDPWKVLSGESSDLTFDHKKKEWPLWARLLEQLAKSGDRGIGDVVKRVIGNENSEAFKQWHRKRFGKDCGCAGRQLSWNKQFPLKK